MLSFGKELIMKCTNNKLAFASINFLPDDKNLALSKLRAFADNKLQVP